MREQKKNSIILSAELSALSDHQNVVRTLRLSGMLEDIGVPFVRVFGWYKGSSEFSFLCVPRSAQEFEAVIDFGLVSFSQESVLLNINEPTGGLERGVFLRYGKSRADERIGDKLIRVTREQARACESFTFRPDNQTYWIAS
jgi:hypothetical protein